MNSEEKKELEEKQKFQRTESKKSRLLGIAFILSSFFVASFAYSSGSVTLQFLCGFLIIPALFVFGVIYIMDS